ncbi:MAG: TonB-dependent receptor plug domain-containing protein [Candidatus Marinimicrobia bacterium]|nr:TonB-dependent receptor plug domain-containing protein [Candidatus Neomarinimicrobiota bacterium]
MKFEIFYLKKLAHQLILAAIVTVCSIQVAAAQSGNTITGYVKAESSEEALPYANIMIKGTSIGTTSNTGGYFVLVNPPAAPCTLMVSYIGFESVTVPIDSDFDYGQVIQIRMSPQAMAGEEVIIVGEQYNVWENAGGVSQITFSARDINVLPSLGEIDIFRSLQLLPGVSGTGDGSAGLYIRGGTPDQNLILYDGMTMYHVDHFFGFFSAFNTDAIKDIQLYKGGYPAKYGGRLSGVVELTGKTGDVNSFKSNISMNLLSVSAVTEVPLFGKGSWITSVRRSYTDFIQSGLYNSIYDLMTGDGNSTTPGGGQRRAGGFRSFQTTTIPSFYFYDLTSKLSLALSPSDNFALTVYSGQDVLDMNQEFTGEFRFRDFLSDQLGEQFEGVSREENTEWGNVGASAKWSRKWNDRLYISLLGATSTYFSDHILNTGANIGTGTEDTSQVFKGIGSFTSDESNRVYDTSFRLDAEYALSQKHRFEFGSWISGTQTDYQAAVRDSIQILNISTLANQYAIYVQDLWKPLPLLELNLGFRTTLQDQTEEWYHAPRFSFKYYLTEKLTLKGAWGQYYQFVNHITNEQVLEGSRDFWLVSDEYLKPGYSEDNIIGLSYENMDFLLESQGYYKSMDNLVEFSRRIRQDADYLDTFFTGTGTAYGIEFLAQKKRGKYTGWLSYTLSETRHTFPAFNDGESFPASHDRTHDLEIVGTYSIGEWDISSNWLYSTGNAYTAPESQYSLTMLNGEEFGYIHVGEKNSYRLPDYHRLDVSISRSFENPSTKWYMGLTLFNLYNNRNIWYRTYDLSVSPIIISDATMLGFTPTIFVKLYIK